MLKSQLSSKHFQSERKMLREKQALKQPSSSPAQRKTKTTEISSRRKMLSYFVELYSFSKRWRDVEERVKREYKNTVYSKGNVHENSIFSILAPSSG